MAASKNTCVSSPNKKRILNSNFGGNFKSKGVHSEDNSSFKGKSMKWQNDYGRDRSESVVFVGGDKKRHKKDQNSKWGHQNGGSSWEPRNKVKIDLAVDQDDTELNINKSFAKGYDRRRRLEELQKLKDRYGNEQDSTDSSSDEDEDGNRLPQEFDKEFLRTLSFLKGKDPRIYNDEEKFFENLDVTNVKDHHVKAVKKEKAVYLRDHERELLLANNGLPNEDDDNEKLKTELFKEGTTYVEEQKQLKESFKQHLIDSDDETDLLIERKKSAKETVKEEEDYYNWLKGQTKHLKEKNLEKDVKYLKKYWNENKLEEDEQFLRDYILKKEYLLTGDSEEVPSYEEIIQEVQEDEKEFERQEVFEHKYNFRFEEPDDEFIKRYPRSMPESMRRKDDKRKDKRLEVRERKIKEKDKKREELKRLKALKRMEIMEKLEKIKQITGNTKVGLQDIDLEEDFDPKKHDKRMQEMFGEEYYDDGMNDEEKPEFPDDEEHEDWDQWNGENTTNIHNEAYEPHCEDPDFIMDCDYDPKASFQEEMINSSKKRKRKLSKLAKALRVKKPTFDPTEKTFEEYFDEYYQLEYEDMIDDLPCRFKYRKVVPNDFGLSIDEILGAEDAELNEWCALKKTCQYRSEEEEKKDLRIFKKKGKDSDKKSKILKSIYMKDEDNKEGAEQTDEPATKTVPQSEGNETDHKKKKKMRRKQKGNKTDSSISDTKKPKNETESKNGTSSKGKKQKKDRKEKAKNVKKTFKKQKYDVDVGMTDERLTAFGINPKRYKNMLMYGHKKNH